MRGRILCRWTRLSSSSLHPFFFLNPFSLDPHTRPLSPFCSLFLSFSLSLFPYPRLSRSCFGQVTGAPVLVTSPRINSRSGLGVCNRRPVAVARASERESVLANVAVHRALSARNLGVGTIRSLSSKYLWVPLASQPALWRWISFATRCKEACIFCPWSQLSNGHTSRTIYKKLPHDYIFYDKLCWW